MSDIKLGQLVASEAAKRDAIHVAIVPLLVGPASLKPGQWVTVLDEFCTTASLADKATGIGIVDPFLDRPAKQGERIWVFMRPSSTNNLRHDWSHPAFDRADRLARTNMKLSVAWMHNFANRNGMTYSNLMAAADQFLKDGQRIWAGGEDQFDTAFWSHYEVLTGNTVQDGHRDSFFAEDDGCRGCNG